MKTNSESTSFTPDGDPSFPASWAKQMAMDAENIAAIGLTCDRIAQRLRMFRAAAETGLGRAVQVSPYFESAIDDTRGRLPCPFGDTGAFAKLNTSIRNIATGKTLEFSDLSLHMIEKHGWFGAAESPFRLDPKTLAQVLEIAPP